MADNAVDTHELEELQQFVQSPGFARFLAHVETEWGAPAQMRMIDAVLHELTPGSTDAEMTTVSQIRAAATQIQKIARWPEGRINELKTGAKPRSMNPMDAIRRIAR